VVAEELQCEGPVVAGEVRLEAEVDLLLVAVAGEVGEGFREVGVEDSRLEDEVGARLEGVDSGEDEARFGLCMGILHLAFGSCV